MGDGDEFWPVGGFGKRWIAHLPTHWENCRLEKTVASWWFVDWVVVCGDGKRSQLAD